MSEIERKLEAKHHDLRDSLFDAVTFAGLGREGLFSTAYSHLLGILELNSNFREIDWVLVRSSTKHFSPQTLNCSLDVFFVLRNLSRNNEVLDAETVGRFDDLLYYFKAPGNDTFELVKRYGNVNVRDLIPQGKNPSFVSLKRFFVLQRGHSASSADRIGLEMCMEYKVDAIETLIREASIRGYSLKSLVAMFKVRRDAKPEQLVEAMDYFNGADELREFAKSVAVSPRGMNFWKAVLEAHRAMPAT